MKKICIAVFYILMVLCINPLCHAMEPKGSEPQNLTASFFIEWSPINFWNTDTNITFTFTVRSLSAQNSLGTVKTSSGLTYSITNYKIIIKDDRVYGIDISLNSDLISASNELELSQFRRINNAMQSLAKTKPAENSMYINNLSENNNSDIKTLYRDLAALVNKIFANDPEKIITPFGSKPSTEQPQIVIKEQFASKSISDEPEKIIMTKPYVPVIHEKTPVVEPIVPVEPENIYIPIELVEPTQHSIIPTKIQPLQAEGHASKSISDQPKFPKLSTLKGQKETVPTSYEENPPIVLPNVPLETESEEYMHKPIELTLPRLTISEPSYTTRVVTSKPIPKPLAAANKIKKSETPKNVALERYQGIARERDVRKTGGSLYASLAKYVGLGALTGALVSGKKLDAPAAEGVLGLLYGLRQEYLAASPGWKAQIAQLNINNISDKTVSIGGKTYLLAKGFDKIETAGYGANEIGDANHYEIYLMPDDAHLVDFFFDITNLLNTMPDAVKQEVAFVALRPTPRVYDTSAITGLFSRQVLPRIVICFKSKMDLFQLAPLVKSMIQSIKNFVLTNTKIQSSGYHPRYSEEITNIIYVGFGSGDYKKLYSDSDVFERKGLPFWRANNDMAYPKNFSEEELKITSKNFKITQ